MSTSAEERFIAAATAPLADNAEMHIAAQRMLEAEMAEMAEGDPEAISAAATRVEQAGSGRWRMVLWILAGVAVLGAAALARWQWDNYSSLRALGVKLPGSSKRELTYEEAFGRSLNAEQLMLMLGDTTRNAPSERLLALHESDPANPAYYVDYVLAYRSERKTLPSDFLETGKRIDPNNAWFPAYAGGLLLEETVQLMPQTPAEKAAKVPRTYNAKDPAKLKEARELFHQAARQSVYDTRQAELFRRRVELLPKRTSAFDHIPAIAYTAGMRTASLPLREFTKMVGIESARLEAENDSQGLRNLIADWDAFMAIYLPSTDAFTVDVLVKMTLVRGGYRDLARAAAKLGLQEDAKRLQVVSDRYEAYHEKRQAAGNARRAANEGMGREMSLLGALSAPLVGNQVLHPPELRSRLGPGRWAEHEFALKFTTMLLLCPTLLMVALFLALYRFRGGELRRKLSARLMQALTAGDWALLLGGGVLLPFTLHQVMARLPWTGAREWGVAELKYLTPAVALSLLAWLLLLLPLAIARHCLRKRLGFLGLRWRFAWIAWLLSGLMIVAIPLAGPAFVPWKNSPLLGVVYTILMTTQAWILTAVCRGLFSRSENLLKRMLLCRILMPGMALAVILAVLSLPLAHHLECHWAQLDEVNEITPEAPAMTRYEYEVMQVARQELLEVVQLPPR